MVVWHNLWRKSRTDHTTFLDGQIEIVISEELISELRRKVTNKFPLFLPHFALLEESLREDAEIAKLGGQTVKVSRDPGDDKIIETAITGKCQYIVSGDKDLLTLGNYQGVQIIMPADFLKTIVN